MHENNRLHFWTRIGNWLHRHPVAIYLIAGAAVVLAASLVAFILLYQKPQQVSFYQPATIQKKPLAPPAPKYYSPLTGEEVATQAITTQPATGIMIENSPDARPQSGLKSAGIVFEAIAEGGITRFLALYQQEKPQLIGPVRSIRLYDVEWLAPFQVSVAHVGGSQQALKKVRNGQYRDVDQFFNSGSYWRTTDHYAPHNVYTSFARLDALNAAKGYTTSTVASFSHKNPAPSKTPNATKINVVISSALYNSSYIYDPATDSYQRSQAGAPHLDREMGQITPAAVVVMNVNEQTVLQDGYREQITTVGSGVATIFQDGIVTTGTWNKSSITNQIIFADAAGKDIPLNRGQTWITAIPNGRGSVSWQ